MSQAQDRVAPQSDTSVFLTLLVASLACDIPFLVRVLKDAGVAGPTLSIRDKCLIYAVLGPLFVIFVFTHAIREQAIGLGLCDADPPAVEVRYFPGRHFHGDEIENRCIPSPLPNGTVSSQGHSMFITMLPMEVRQQIYDLVLSDNIFRLQLRTVNSNSDAVSPSKQKQENLHPTAGQSNGKTYRRFRSKSGFYMLLALPLTCRIVYEESVDLIYKRNRFLLHNRGSSQGLERLHELLPYRALSSIRHVEVLWSLPRHLLSCRDCEEYCNAFWNMLASLEGLQRLRVIFDTGSIIDKRWWRILNVDSLRHQLERFREIEVVLQLPTTLDELAQDMSEGLYGCKVVVGPSPAVGTGYANYEVDAFNGDLNEPIRTKYGVSNSGFPSKLKTCRYNKPLAHVADPHSTTQPIPPQQHRAAEPAPCPT